MTAKDQIAHFLATKGATVCPPSKSFDDQARPLAHVRREREQVLTDAVDVGDEEIIGRELAADRRWLELQGVR